MTCFSYAKKDIFVWILTISGNMTTRRWLDSYVQKQPYKTTHTVKAISVKASANMARNFACCKKKRSFWTSLLFSLITRPSIVCVIYIVFFWISKASHLQFDSFFWRGTSLPCHNKTCFWYPNKSLLFRIPKATHLFWYSSFWGFEGGFHCHPKTCI